MNNFIVSGKGFLKSTEFNKETLKTDITWTSLIREAQRFNAKPANTVVKKHNLEAFVWNPYKEQPVRGKWEVVKRQSHYDFCNENEHKALEWKAKKVMMESKTDVKHLMSNGVDKTEYYSEQEAREIAKERNQAIIIELQEKMERVIEKQKN